MIWISLITVVVAVAAARHSSTPLLDGTSRAIARDAASDSACEPDWIATFGAMPGTDDDVFAFAEFDDGGGPAMYVGGAFTRAGNVEAPNLARWDGVAWSAIPGAPDGPVYALTVYDDGTGAALYVGGKFANAGGIAAANVARWDGANWSALGAGVDAPVRALVGKGDSRGAPNGLYVGGDFLTAGGQTVWHVARWDGQAWSDLDGGANATVRALAVHDDGSGDGPAVFAAGDFVIVDGVPASAIARWDGAGWSAMQFGFMGLTNSALAMAVFDDGRGDALYVGGSFVYADGLLVNRIARWDGASWDAVGSGFDGPVRSLCALDGRATLIAGGEFTHAGDVDASRVAQWDGERWSALAGATTMSGSVAAIAESPDGDEPSLLIGGTFLGAGGAIDYVARWDGSEFLALGDGLDGTVYCATTFAPRDGESVAVVGGGFRIAGGRVANRVAAWNGESWSPLGLGFSGLVLTLLATDDGVLYAGGTFSSAEGNPASRIARWNGSAWEPLGLGLSGAVRALALFDDGRGEALYAGGSFTLADGAPATFVAKWDGNAWSALGDGLGPLPIHLPTLAGVYALRAFHDAADNPLLAVGGIFNTAEGEPAKNIAIWDGTSWSTFGAGMNNSVMALEAFETPNGPVLVAGGYFTSADGASVNHIAQWDGTAWSPLGEGVGAFEDGSAPARALHATNIDGVPALFVGGDFSTAGGIAASHVARWDGVAWSALGDGVPDYVRALVVFEPASTGAPSLLVGGTFITSPAGDSLLARWQLCPATCAGDLDANGAVDASDLAALLGAWGTGAADLDGDGDTGAADLAILLGGWGACR